MINVSVTGLQEAQNALRKEIEKLVADKKSVLVGIHEGAGQVEDGTISMARLGAIQHFGDDREHIPARPWLDVGVKTGVKDYVSILKDNGDDLDNALNLVGLVAVGKVQQYMIELKTPKNAPSTIKRKKGVDNPLIDNGALMQSVTYSITNEEVKEGLGNG